jgi:hypothetical protein
MLADVVVHLQQALPDAFRIALRGGKSLAEEYPGESVRNLHWVS